MVTEGYREGKLVIFGYWLNTYFSLDLSDMTAISIFFFEHALCR